MHEDTAIVKFFKFIARVLLFFGLFFLLVYLLPNISDLVLDIIFPNGWIHLSEEGRDMVYWLEDWSVYATATILAIVVITFISTEVAKYPFSWSTVVQRYGLSSKRLVPEFLEGYGLAAGLMLAFCAILYMLGYFQVQTTNWQGGLFLSWFVFFLIQPFAEEVVFRGVIQNYATYYFNPVAGLIIGAVAFAAVHTSNDHFSWIGGLDILVGGLLMGLMFQKTGRLWLPTGLHAGWNFWQSTFWGLPVSGMETYHVLETETSGPNWLSGGSFGPEGSLLAVLLTLLACIWYRKAYQNETPFAKAKRQEILKHGAPDPKDLTPDP